MMKNKLFTFCGTIFGGLLLSTAGVASAQVVYSSNVVGFQKVDVGGNNLEMSSTPFVGPNSTISNVFSGQLAPGFVPNLADNLLKYDPVSQSYRTFFQDLNGVWKDSTFTVANNEPVTPGEGFWIQNKQGNVKTVVLVGEVPTDATIDVPVTSGLQIIHNPYPADIPIQDADLEGLASAGVVASLADNIYVWDSASGYYDLHYLKLNFINQTTSWRKLPGDGSAEVDSDLVLSPGSAIWFNRKAGNFTWTITKPYVYP